MGSGLNVTVAESVLGDPGVQGLLVTGPTEPLMALAGTKESSQDSTSEPERVMRTGVSSAVGTTLSSAVGAQLTKIVTVAGVEVSVPSLVV